MTRLIALALILPGAAFAHPGHVAETVGHAHWLAVAAVSLAALVTAVAGGVALRSRRRKGAAAKPTRV